MPKELTEAALFRLRKRAKSMLSTPNFMDHRISLQKWAASASPEVVLSLIDTIECLQMQVKPACTHFQMPDYGSNEWGCTCRPGTYHIPEGGELADFCSYCGGPVEIDPESSCD